MNQTVQRPDWDAFYMGMAYYWAQRSPDPSTKVGAVIVDKSNRLVSAGYNGWPKGIAAFAVDDPRWSREGDLKYKWMEHCERNAIYNAANHGLSIAGCTLYVPWLPCCDCARAIVTCGIDDVVVHKSAVALIEARWSESNEIAMQMFNETGVGVHEWEGELPLQVPIMQFGKSYKSTPAGLVLTQSIPAKDDY